jgi:hypothetical protein
MMRKVMTWRWIMDGRRSTGKIEEGWGREEDDGGGKIIDRCMHKMSYCYEHQHGVR